MEEETKRIRELLELLVKLRLGEIGADKSLTEMIHFLHGHGCDGGQISRLLGKDPNSVNPILSRHRAKSKKPPRPGRGRNA